MTAIVNVHDAKTNFSKLLARAHAGEEIILAKAGKPYAKLVPFSEAEKPRREPAAGKSWVMCRTRCGSIRCQTTNSDAWEGKYSNIV